MAERPTRSDSHAPNSLATRFRSLFRQETFSIPPQMSSYAAPQPSNQGFQTLHKKFPCPQPQSSFLTKLPLEIREAIYVHVFGHSLVHLIDLGHRLAHVSCAQEVWDGHRHGVEGFNGYPVLHKEEHPDDALLALCKTCRTVYNETVPHLYSDPRFAIWQPHVLFTIPLKSPYFLSHVRSLQFRISYYRFPQLDDSIPNDMATWNRLCSTLSSMKSLHFLRIYIHQDFFFVEPRDPSLVTEYVAGLLEPLKAIDVKCKESAFEVSIGWRLTDLERQIIGEVPFQIKEVGERGYAGRKASDGNPYG